MELCVVSYVELAQLRRGTGLGFVGFGEARPARTRWKNFVPPGRVCSTSAAVTAMSLCWIRWRSSIRTMASRCAVGVVGSCGDAVSDRTRAGRCPKEGGQRCLDDLLGYLLSANRDAWGGGGMVPWKVLSSLGAVRSAGDFPAGGAMARPCGPAWAVGAGDASTQIVSVARKAAAMRGTTKRGRRLSRSSATTPRGMGCSFKSVPPRLRSRLRPGCARG